MDDQPLWKKEVSFGRKPKEENDTGEPTTNDEPSAPTFKQELSFKRAEPVVAEGATDEVAPDEQSADPLEQVSNPEPEPEEKVWTKEVSFSRAQDEQSVEPPAQVSAPGPR